MVMIGMKWSQLNNNNQLHIILSMMTFLILLLSHMYLIMMHIIPFHYSYDIIRASVVLMRMSLEKSKNKLSKCIYIPAGH
jgi:hypothetical protein